METRAPGKRARRQKAAIKKAVIPEMVEFCCERGMLVVSIWRAGLTSKVGQELRMGRWSRVWG
jgi:hypothetical protein